MPEPPTAELSSLASALEELSRRITELADKVAGGELDAVANELYEVERSLIEGRRRLDRLLTLLR